MFVLFTAIWRGCVTKTVERNFVIDATSDGFEPSATFTQRTANAVAAGRSMTNR